jgi:hypothetical protein
VDRYLVERRGREVHLEHAGYAAGVIERVIQEPAGEPQPSRLRDNIDSPDADPVDLFPASLASHASHSERDSARVERSKGTIIASVPPIPELFAGLAERELLGLLDGLSERIGMFP